MINIKLPGSLNDALRKISYEIEARISLKSDVVKDAYHRLHKGLNKKEDRDDEDRYPIYKPKDPSENWMYIQLPLCLDSHRLQSFHKQQLEHIGSVIQDIVNIMPVDAQLEKNMLESNGSYYAIVSFKKRP